MPEVAFWEDGTGFGACIVSKPRSQLGWEWLHHPRTVHGLRDPSADTRTSSSVISTILVDSRAAFCNEKKIYGEWDDTLESHCLHQSQGRRNISRKKHPLHVHGRILKTELEQDAKRVWMRKRGRCLDVWLDRLVMPLDLDRNKGQGTSTSAKKDAASLLKLATIFRPAHWCSNAEGLIFKILFLSKNVCTSERYTCVKPAFN